MKSTDTHDDTVLLRQVAAGDETAFTELHDLHGRHVIRYAWAVSPSVDAVHELVQDTFMTLWLKAPTVHLAGTSILPWLLVTCRNHARNRRRKDARWADMTEIDEDHMDDRHAAVDELKWVIQDIEQLPVPDKQVVDLCLLQGYTYAEAAQMIGTTPAAVGKRLQRARAILNGASK